MSSRVCFAAQKASVRPERTFNGIVAPVNDGAPA